MSDGHNSRFLRNDNRPDAAAARATSEEARPDPLTGPVSGSRAREGVRGELVRHPEQFGSELNHVQVALAEQSAIARMVPQVLGSVPSLRTQQGRCEKMNDELCGA